MASLLFDKVSTKMSSNKSLATVTVILVTDLSFHCPHCNMTQTGFIGNPAGHSFDCDHCSKEYYIDKDADIEFKGN